MKHIPLTLLSESSAEKRGKIHLEQKDQTVVLSGDKGKIFVCGYCGSILVNRFPNIDKIQNAAVKCNRCGWYNDLSKIAKYPTAYRELFYNKSKSDALIMQHVFVNRSPWSEVLLNVHDSLSKTIIDYQKERPEILYHYTSPLGLLGILGSNKLWATEANCLNDATELKYAKDMLLKAIEKMESSVNDDIKREFWKRAKSIINPDSSGEVVFISCFCEERDLLSQWRGYSGGIGGYAVGFDSEIINRSGLMNGNKMVMRKVVYDPSLQRSLIDNLMGAANAAIDKFQGDIKYGSPEEFIPMLGHVIGCFFSEYLYIFKNSSFHEEKEWRIVYKMGMNDVINGLKFRSNQSFVVPYIENQFRTKSNYSILPIKEIILGPNPHNETSRKSIDMVLQKNDYEHVSLINSNVPLRF